MARHTGTTIGLAVGVAGFVLIGLITLSGQSPGGGGSFDPYAAMASQFNMSDEFVTVPSCVTVGNFVGAATGAATCAEAGDIGHPGILAMTTDTVATNGARLASSASFKLGGGDSQYCTKALVKVQNLSTSVQQYLFRYGFNKPTSQVNSTDAVQATYQFSANGNVHVWALETIKASVVTRINCDGTGGTTNVPITAGTWYTLELCENAAGTSATLAVNGTVCATQSTAANLPLSSTTLSVGIQCFNDTGSVPSSQVCFVDYEATKAPFLVSR